MPTLFHASLPYVILSHLHSLIVCHLHSHLCMCEDFFLRDVKLCISLGILTLSCQIDIVALKASASNALLKTSFVAQFSCVR